MTIAIVIPAYNEAKSIATVLKSIPTTVYSFPVFTVVVDDGSRDATAELAQMNGAHVLTHIINRGQGAALKTGIDYSIKQGADIVVTFDADGQHKAEEIEAIVKPLVDENVQVVLGSRFLNRKPQNIPSVRYAILKAGVLFTCFLSKIKVTDTHNGFRAFTAAALNKFTLIEDKMEHASEILDQISSLKMAYKEVPVTISYSNYSLQKGQKSSDALKIAFKVLLHKLK